MDYELTETKYGFRWGPLTVERLISDPKFGVLIEVSTPMQRMEIRSSPQGSKLEVCAKGPKSKEASR